MNFGDLGNRLREFGQKVKDTTRELSRCPNSNFSGVLCIARVPTKY